MTTATPDRLAGMQVLVVEDVDALRHLLRCMLEMEGATVAEAGTGRAACELARRQTFDVVLTDLGLPDMPGEAVITGVLAASEGRTATAVVSGAGEDALARALAVGAERAFAKPVDWEELIRYLVRKRTTTPASAGPGPTTALTVLIVEDDAAMRALMRDVLQRAGHRVIERPDGTDVPALAGQGDFDAVILDQEMPGQNGLDLLSLLRRRRPAVPVILVTAFGGPEIAQEAARRGAHSYLEKPFRVSAMLDTLAAVPSAPQR